MEPVQLPVAQRAKNALAVTPEYEKQLQALAVKHTGITAIRDDASLRDCHSARMEIKNTRLSIEKKGKTAREDAQAFAKAVIEEQKRLVGIIEPEEQRLEALQESYARAAEEKRQAKLKAEQERIAAIERRIAELDRVPVLLVGASAAVLAAKLDELGRDNPEEWSQELLPKATFTHRDVMAKLEKMCAASVATEAEAKRQAEERAKLEAERAELERQRQEQAARDRKAKAEEEARQAAARRKIEEEERAARLRIEEAERLARLAREEADRIARAALESAERKAKEAREAEEVRLKAERDKVDADRRALEEAARAEQFRKDEEARAIRLAEQVERERIENERAAAEREARRKAQDRLDAYSLLATFCERYGTLEEFSEIAAKIDAFLADAPMEKAA